MPRTLTVFAICIASLITARAQDFQVEKDIKRQVVLPKGVLAILRRNNYVSHCFRNDEFKPPIAFSGKWFQAARIDLNGDRYPDYVVKANIGCLYGANIGPFWVFRGGASGFRLVLELHELGMSIDHHRVKGYRDISAFRATAVKGFESRWAFNGKRYVLRRSRSFHLG